MSIGTHGNQEGELQRMWETAGMNGSALERARKNARVLGQRVEACGIEPVADASGVGKSTISAWFNINRDALGRALAAMGLKVVPVSMQCYDPKQIEALHTLAQLAMARMRSADDLTFEEDQ